MELSKVKNSLFKISLDLIPAMGVPIIAASYYKALCPIIHELAMSQFKNYAIIASVGIGSFAISMILAGIFLSAAISLFSNIKNLYKEIIEDKKPKSFFDHYFPFLSSKL